MSAALIVNRCFWIEWVLFGSLCPENSGSMNYIDKMHTSTWQKCVVFFIVIILWTLRLSPFESSVGRLILLIFSGWTKSGRKFLTNEPRCVKNVKKIEPKSTNFSIFKNFSQQNFEGVRNHALQAKKKAWSATNFTFQNQRRFFGPGLQAGPLLRSDFRSIACVERLSRTSVSQSVWGKGFLRSKNDRRSLETSATYSKSMLLNRMGLKSERSDHVIKW